MPPRRGDPRNDLQGLPAALCGREPAPLRREGAPRASRRQRDGAGPVEDEDAIVRFGKRVLESLGYRVLAASTPTQALRLAAECTGDLHLLVTDVVMPEMNGRELAQRIQALKPGVRRLYMSGYPADAIAHRAYPGRGRAFHPKALSRAARSPAPCAGSWVER